MTPSEDDLILRAQKGDPEAFTEIVKKYEPYLLNVIRKKADPDKVEDVAQRVWLCLWQKISQFKFKSAFRTWLTRLALNECYMEYRERNREVTEDDETITKLIDYRASVKPMAEDYVYANELKPILRDALNLVGEKRRQAIYLQEVEELSMQEIAEALGASIGAIKSYIHRGKKNVKKYLHLMLNGVAPALMKCATPACTNQINKFKRTRRFCIDCQQRMKAAKRKRNPITRADVLAAARNRETWQFHPKSLRKAAKRLNIVLPPMPHHTYKENGRFAKRPKTQGATA